MNNGIADLRAKLNRLEDAFRMERTVARAEEWVSEAEPGKSCEKCIGMEDVFRIQLIYDVGTYLCRACITEAAVLANRETLELGEVT